MTPHSASRGPTPIAENLARVRERVAAAAARSGRPAEAVTLIAVSKGQPAEAVRAAFGAGQRIFGENRVQEGVAKVGALPAEAVWHLIGHLQTNKARLVPGHFPWVHTVDGERVAHALERSAAAAGTALEVLIQLNWCREPTKSGVSDRAGLDALLETVRQCSALRLRGLMSMPDPAFDEARTRAHFAEIRELLGSLRGEFGLGPEFSALSLGMSHDFEWAIEEGATIVRVGTAIFGARS